METDIRKKAAAQMGLQTKLGFLYEGETKIPLNDSRQDQFLKLVEELVEQEGPEAGVQELALQKMSDHRKFFFQGGILMVRHLGQTCIASGTERDQYRKVLDSLA